MTLRSPTAYAKSLIRRELRKPLDMRQQAKLRADLTDEWEPVAPAADPRFPRRAREGLTD